MNHLKQITLIISVILPVLIFASCSKDEQEENVDEVLLPIITSITPLQGQEGDPVTIKGANFSANTTQIKVDFNGVESDEISFSSIAQISTVVPKGATTGEISVTIVEQTVKGPIFTIEEEGTGVITPPVGQEKTPSNFKIAFFGDSNIGSAAKAVLNLVKSEGADAVVHPGDLNYAEIPVDFESHINEILGADYPYFFCVGNHDDEAWNGPNKYQSFLEERFKRLGISWKGQLGVTSSFYYKGIFFVISAPDEFGITSASAGNHIRKELAQDESVWRISFWHKNQRLMQVGGKSNEAGWNVYEESRKGGAIIATAHEHSYSRTHEMSNFQNQVISSTENTVNLWKDDASTSSLDEGRSFAFVSGLGGKSIRDAESGLDQNPWWADVYHSNNGGQHGALFGEFNYEGDTSLARFYFKDIDGTVRDEFFVRSNN
ncbi:IPT/TIG domain-containing protein [Ekhidna sp.]